MNIQQKQSELVSYRINTTLVEIRSEQGLSITKSKLEITYDSLISLY